MHSLVRGSVTVFAGTTPLYCVPAGVLPSSERKGPHIWCLHFARLAHHRHFIYIHWVDKSIYPHSSLPQNITTNACVHLHTYTLVHMHAHTHGLLIGFAGVPPPCLLLLSLRLSGGTGHCPPAFSHTPQAVFLLKAVSSLSNAPDFPWFLS